MSLYRIEYPPLLVIEPTCEEIRLSSQKLAAWYNDPENRHLMTSEEQVSPGEVPEIYAARAAVGGRNFMIFQDNRLIGDADLRELDAEAGEAEFAIMIGGASDRGSGLGTKAATAVHHFAFSAIGLKRLRLSVAAFNKMAIGSYLKLGYLEAGTGKPILLKEHPHDIVMTLEPGRFYLLQPGARDAVISARCPG